MPVRDVVILGSTGSIGTQALEVIADAPDRFDVVGLAAGGSQVELLARQAFDFDVKTVAITDESAVESLTPPCGPRRLGGGTTGRPTTCRRSCPARTPPPRSSGGPPMWC